MSEAASVSAPVSSPATTVSAPATTAAPTAPAAPTSPSSPAATPGFDPKQHQTMKGALDAFVKSKLTAATETTVTPAESVSTTTEPAETVTPAEPPIQPAEKATQPVAETTEPSVEVGPDPGLNIDPKVLKSVSPRVRAVLKMLVDPATQLPIGAGLRKEIVDNFYVGKSVRDAGIPVAALRDYLSVAPTPDVLRNVSENATQHARMLADYAADPGVFAEQLYATNQEAFQNLVSSVTDPTWLQATYPKSYLAIARNGTHNYLDNALADAQRIGDADLEAAVTKLMEWGGLASPPQNQPAAQQQPDNPLQERVDALEQERQRFQQERQGAFINSAYQRAVVGVAERINSVVAEASADSPFNEKTQGRIRDEIGRKLYASVTGNQHIIRTLDGLIRSGNGNPAHLEQVASYLQSQALALLPSVSREVVEEYSELVGPAVAQRQQKVEKVLSQRAPMSGGKPATPAPPAFDPKAFGTMGQAFDAFVKHRLSG